MNNEADRIRGYIFSDKTDQFENELLELYNLKNEKSAKTLLSVLRNDEDYSDEMYQVLHTIEGFDKEDYLRAYISSVEDGGFDSYWFGILLMRIMNSSDYLSVLNSLIAEASPNAIKNLESVCNEISLIDESFREIADKLLR